MDTIQVNLTSESNKVLDSIDPIHRHSAINLGLSLLSRTSIYKNFLKTPTESVEIEDNFDIQSLSEVVMTDDSVRVDNTASVKTNVTQLVPKSSVNVVPDTQEAPEGTELGSDGEPKLVISWDKQQY